MTATENASRKSTILSWLAVFVLGLVIYGLLRAITWLWGGEEDAVFSLWLLRLYGVDWWLWEATWRTWVFVALALVILLSAVVGLTLARKRSRDHQGDIRVVAVGASALYLPSFLGSIPALVGLVSEMLTPFLGGGLISSMAARLPDLGLLHEQLDWIARGVVSPSLDSRWWTEAGFMVAQSLVALGLALTMVGLIQVLSAYREKRLQTQGLYATVRHPQHLGIALWTFGLAFAVNGTAAYITWFTVVYLYVVLAVSEENHLARQFGSSYDGYRKATPFAIPFVNIGLPLPNAGVPRVAAFIAYYIVGMAILCLIMGAIGVQHPHFL